MVLAVAGLSNGIDVQVLAKSSGSTQTGAVTKFRMARVNTSETAYFDIYVENKVTGFASAMAFGNVQIYDGPWTLNPDTSGYTTYEFEI